MFPTFSGNSRRPRQLNLSGRQNPNPFAKQGSATPSHNVLADAQQGRLARQQERDRLRAAGLIQRTWRGHSSRSRMGNAAREEWDLREGQSVTAMSSAYGSAEGPLPPYSSDEEAYTQLSSLLRFYVVESKKDEDRTSDILRLSQCCHRIAGILVQSELACRGGNWPLAYTKMEETCLRGLRHAGDDNSRAIYLSALHFAFEKIPSLSMERSTRYYATMGTVIQTTSLSMIDHLLVPLAISDPLSWRAAYAGFARYILTLPELDSTLCDEQPLAVFAERIDMTKLVAVLASSLSAKETSEGVAGLFRTSQPLLQRIQINPRKSEAEWLLAHLIYFNRYNDKTSAASSGDFDQQYSLVVANMLPIVADASDVKPRTDDFEATLDCTIAFPAFVEGQLSSLVNQRSVSHLVAQMGIYNRLDDLSDDSSLHVHDLSKIVANYILTLLRLFPRRGDDIRMWLYIGSVNRNNVNGKQQSASIIRFLWQGVQTTSLYTEIYRDPRAAIELLRSNNMADEAARRIENSQENSIGDQWRMVLLFIELYSFVLKIMDDEEFFARNDPETNTSGRPGTANLNLDSISLLTTFLKNLGFTMYYNASEILGTQDQSSQSMESLFNAPAEASLELRPDTASISSLQGISLDYMKGAVTGLVRALYERDSRRPFLPRGHWLMTSRFDMTSFIDSVVEEEERRNKLQDAEDEDEADSESETFEGHRLSGLVGTGHAQRQHKVNQMKRQQQKASRRRYLQAVAPRLEILQNMPFLIPFTTRVQIFRRFVHMDMLKRRGGTVDPEIWRLRMQPMDIFRPGPHERHHAKIRRGHEFDDAFDQYYHLGADLKEPISITFVDQFDQPEAGIDGGGVTKEFLTSVTNQAFGEADGVRLFVENDKHLIFPNPSAIEEQKQLLREADVSESSLDFRVQISKLRQHYEFLGRIIGKCLYEGILVDIGFAPFFLLKWALTGGANSTPRESGYRANLNDLRDYDEELYRGLIQLKNFTGNVEDTFSLNFTVTDTLTLPPLPNSSITTPRTKQQTHDLIPDGSTTSVTTTNRLAYISYIARHRLSHQPYLQTQAFLRGLSSLIQPTWLSMFNHSELQTLVGGAPTPISIPDLRAHTIYSGVYALGSDGHEHPSVAIFWSVMQSLSDADRRKVLKFVTSTPRAPLLGFGSLTPRLSIRDSGADQTRLPSASTCVNLLKLPRYGSERVCREKLLLAVNSGAGFDLS